MNSSTNMLDSLATENDAPAASLSALDDVRVEASLETISSANVQLKKNVVQTKDIPKSQYQRMRPSTELQNIGETVNQLLANEAADAVDSSENEGVVSEDEKNPLQIDEEVGKHTVLKGASHAEENGKNGVAQDKDNSLSVPDGLTDATRDITNRTSQEPKAEDDV